MHDGDPAAILRERSAAYCERQLTPLGGRDEIYDSKPNGSVYSATTMAFSTRVLLTAHVAGWTVLGLTRAASLRLIVSPEQWPRLAALKAGNALFLLVASSFLILLYQRNFMRRRAVWNATVILGPLGAAAAVFFADSLLLRPFVDGGQPQVEWIRLPFAMVSHGLLLFGWTGLYLAVRFAHQRDEKARDALRAEAAAHRAQLLALHYQLNPHFLFNALNASRGLVSDAPERARDVIGRLAAFLRYALDTDPDERVTLAEEIEAIRHFAAIDKARFAERVHFAFEVDQSALTARVPPLFMMPLVENASKHGDPGSDGVTVISIAAFADEGELRVCVRNTGRLVSTPVEVGTHRGIGLPNVDARMEHAFPGRYRRVLYEQEGEVVCEICIETGESHERL